MEEKRNLESFLRRHSSDATCLPLCVSKIYLRGIRPTTWGLFLLKKPLGRASMMAPDYQEIRIVLLAFVA